MTVKNLTDFLVVAILGLGAFVVAATFYSYVETRWQAEGWYAIIVQAMLYYLSFSMLHSMLMVSFSFLEHLFKEAQGRPSYHPFISVIIPCFNEEKVVAKAIESALNLSYPNFEVLVIDDGSLDMTTVVAKKYEREGLLRILFQKNAGKSSALNLGISESRGDFVLCVDADSVVGENALMNAMHYFELDSNLGAVAGNVRVGNSKSLLCKFQKLEYIIGLNLHKRAQSFLNMVAIVPGPIGVFKREALVEIGGYHSDTFAEDCDLSMRLLLNGYNIKYAPDVMAYTEAPEVFLDLLVQRYRWSRGMIQSIVKNLYFLRPSKFSIRNCAVLLYMTIETILIPMVNFLFALISVQHTLAYSHTYLLGIHFLGLIELDMAIALYSLSTERNAGGYFLLSFLNRVTYGFALEVLRFFTIFDELLRVPMKWGTIERKGMS